MTRENATTVLVVGAGPVGLFTALELARRGVDVYISDPDRLTKNYSYGLALHPETLELLDDAGVSGEVIAEGLVVNRVAFYSGRERVAEIRLGDLMRRFPFLVTIPQSALERILERRLRELGVKVAWNRRAAEIRMDAGGITTRLDRLDDVGTGYPYMRFERTVTGSSTITSRYVVGADGYHSFVRESMHEEYRTMGPRETYCLFEFESAGKDDRAREAAVAFHGDTANVLWPLPENRNRWMFQVPEGEDAPLTAEMMRRLLDERAPWYRGEAIEITWRAIVEFEPRLVQHFGSGATWLAGDAAHLTGPIGVQSMNIGLREGRDIAHAIAGAAGGGAGAGGGGAPASALDGYARERLREWNRLLGVEGQLEARGDAPAWARDRRQRMASLIPASGRDLLELLGRLGLGWSGAGEARAGG